MRRLSLIQPYFRPVLCPCGPLGLGLFKLCVKDKYQKPHDVTFKARLMNSGTAAAAMTVDENSMKTKHSQ